MCVHCAYVQLSTTAVVASSDACVVLSTARLVSATDETDAAAASVVAAD